MEKYHLNEVPSSAVPRLVNFPHLHRPAVAAKHPAAFRGSSVLSGVPPPTAALRPGGDAGSDEVRIAKEATLPVTLPPMLLGAAFPSPLGLLGEHALLGGSAGEGETKMGRSDTTAVVLSGTPTAEGGHISICSEMTTKVCLPGMMVSVLVSLENESEYEVRRVHVEVVKRLQFEEAFYKFPEKVSITRDMLVNSYRYDYVQDFLNATAVVHVRLPPFIDPNAVYFIQVRAEINMSAVVDPFCRVPLVFSNNPADVTT